MVMVQISWWGRTEVVEEGAVCQNAEAGDQRMRSTQGIERAHDNSILFYRLNKPTTATKHTLCFLEP
jgi:hypothetical protein